MNCFEHDHDKLYLTILRELFLSHCEAYAPHANCQYDLHPTNKRIESSPQAKGKQPGDRATKGNWRQPIELGQVCGHVPAIFGWISFTTVVCLVLELVLLVSEWRVRATRYQLDYFRSDLNGKRVGVDYIAGLDIRESAEVLPRADDHMPNAFAQGWSTFAFTCELSLTTFPNS